MNLRKSIKKSLAEKNMKQQELAEKLDISAQGMSQLAAQTSCTGATLQKLADAFGMKVSEFIAMGEE